MKKIILLLFFGLLSFALFAQEEQRIQGAFYAIAPGFSNYHLLKINPVLKSKGIDGIPPFVASVGFGVALKISQLNLSLDLGIGGGISQKTTLAILPAKFAMGYQFKRCGLVLGGTLSLDLLRLGFYTDQGSVDLNNTEAPYSTYVHMNNLQWMAGPVIDYRWEWCRIRLGYDFGILPTRWRSEAFRITGGEKERLHRVYLQYVVNITKF